MRYLFDDERMQNGSLEVRHAIPYSDLTGLSDSDRHRLVLDKLLPLEFAHTLADQIGGQLDAGLLISGFYEDRYGEPDQDPLSRYMDTFIATRRSSRVARQSCCKPFNTTTGDSLFRHMRFGQEVSAISCCTSASTSGFGSASAVAINAFGTSRIKGRMSA